MTNDDGRVHVETDQARGASTPGVGRYVLGVSLVLIIVIFAALLLF
ncbi:hypothetical protein [Sphingomonas sp. Mn802worker]|nr:hypothetical protein [Sphingomonas sp. Mn802worker]